ncbi:MAG: hypothetical protein SXV54_18405 [Chloroflexota bacterium]|nr:hypothetical protein [Chloroflexota bacterium]
MNIWTRLWFFLLIACDRLLGTRLVEWEMTRLEHRLEAFEAQASTLQQQMEDLNLLLHVVQVQLCVIYLRQRHTLRSVNWLRFAPAESVDEERDLDLLIGRLVKHELATVRTEPAGEQVYIYHLRPDWTAIVNLLSAWKGMLDPVTAAWLDEVRSDESDE